MNCFLIIDMALKQMKSCQVHGDLQVQKKKEQHGIKMAGQDKRHKSERVNANTALYPPGFAC